LRTFVNLFRIKKYQSIEILWIGNSKFIFLKMPKVKLFKSLVTYANYFNYIILIVDSISDIYIFNEEMFNLSDGFIIFYK
jgi:hypothetical protein